MTLLNSTTFVDHTKILNPTLAWGWGVEEQEFEQANLPGGGWRTFELINAQRFAKKVNLLFPYDLVINFPYCVQYISYTFIAENLMLSKVTSQVDYFFLLIIMSLHNVLIEYSKVKFLFGHNRE